MERLDKLLASTGLWSRSEVKELIRSRRVAVRGECALSAEQKCGPQDEICVDGQRVDCGGFVYLMLHKPAGVLSATEDPSQSTVLDLLPAQYRKKGVFPVGRLDKDTTGLLLLTDDGALAHRLLSPRRHVDKVYYARVDGVLDETDVRAFADGMTLGDGTRCMSAELELMEGGTACRVTLQEGKYHQVKRMLAARGKPVTALHRLSMGPLRLDPALEPGRWRPLTGEETRLLRGGG